MQSVKYQLFPLTKKQNLTLMQYQDAQLKVLPHHIKLHPNQIKNVWENEADMFCFLLA